MADRQQTRRSLGAGRSRFGHGLLAVGAAWAIVAVALAVGCESRDPNADLTDEEGAALLKSVRESPPRPDDLSPGEKRWLRDYLGRGKGR